MAFHARMQVSFTHSSTSRSSFRMPRATERQSLPYFSSTALMAYFTRW
jgi:hypothetical protein